MVSEVIVLNGGLCSFGSPQPAGQAVSRRDFENMVRDARITDDSTLAAYALLLLHELKL